MDFLDRIKWVLGGRKKHPWGESIGLGVAVTNSVFNGQVPKVPALQVIQRAEHVSLDWLISGLGAPYLVPNYGDDAGTARALSAFLATHADWKTVVLRDPAARALVVVTGPAMAEGASTSYQAVELFIRAEKLTVQAASRGRHLYEAAVDAETLRQLMAGEIGARHLLGDDETPGILAAARPADHGQVSAVADSVASYNTTPADEAHLVSHYRHLLPRQRAALVEVARSMDRTVDVLQRPPGGIIDPDLHTEADALTVERQLPAAEKVRS